MGLYFDDISVGQKFRSNPRMLTQDDVKKFADLTGDFNKLHLDADYAKSTVFERPISHGLLVLGIALGQWYSLGITADSIVAFVGINNLSFRAPVYPGDNISLESEVISKRESRSRPDAGVVTIRDAVKNQKGTAVLEFDRILMLKKKETGRVMLQ
ncbi:MAG: MaoC family dehydratase N-terminal domain-containing protein [Thaumarchaeota archaeon]|nr:MaoC family dehydratase N-terminal domain-containing protein [Nitrososphaerota archaeon]